MNQKINFFFVSIISALVYPISVFSADGPSFFTSTVGCSPDPVGLLGGDLGCTILRVVNVLRILNPVLLSLAFVVFFWGLSKFILNSGNKDAIEKGKNYMFWAVLALFILVSFRVIIGYMASDFGLGDTDITPFIPQA